MRESMSRTTSSLFGGARMGYSRTGRSASGRRRSALMTTSATALPNCSRRSIPAPGEVTGKCFSRRRAGQFLRFMDEIAAKHPVKETHVILDNLSTHSGPQVDKWLASHQNFQFHFTPAGSSWLNQVEIWFGII